MSELIDRQAFIEQERKLYCEDCDRRKGTKNGKPNVICYEIGEVPCRACWLDDALTDLEDFPAASPWHRCEDELPPAHENLLCCGSRGGMFVGWVLGSAVCIFGSCTGFVHGGKGRQFTHWMPLPEPPEEDKNGN